MTTRLRLLNRMRTFLTAEAALTPLTSSLGKEIRCGIQTFSIDGVLNKEHFYGKIMQKMCTKS